MRYLNIKVMNVKISLGSYYNVWCHFLGGSYLELKMSVAAG